MSLEIATGQHVLVKNITKRFVAFIVGFAILMSATVWGIHTYGAPAHAADLPLITNIEYTYDENGNPTELRVTGLNFDQITHARAKLDGYTPYDLTISAQTSTSITVTVPSDLPYGNYNLSLNNAQGLGAEYGGAIDKSALKPVVDDVDVDIQTNRLVTMNLTGRNLLADVTIYICGNKGIQECKDVTIYNRTDTALTMTVNTSGFLDDTYTINMYMREYSSTGTTTTYPDAFTITHPDIDVSLVELPNQYAQLTFSGTIPSDVLYLKINGQITSIPDDFAETKTVTVDVSGMGYGSFDLAFVLRDSGLYEVPYPGAITRVQPPATITQVDQYPYNDGTIDLNIFGTDFTEEMTLTIGGVAIPNVYYIDPGFIIASIGSDALQPGTYDMVLTDLQGREASFTDAVTVALILPVVDTYVLERPEDGLLKITLEGTGLSGAAVSIQGEAVSVTESADNYLAFEMEESDLPPGEYEVTVTRPHGSTTTTIIVDDIYAVSISNAFTWITEEGHVGVEIYGYNFTEETTATLGGEELEIYERGDTYMYAILPDDTPVGGYELQVHRSDGQTATYGDLIYVQRPAIANVTFETQGDYIVATIHGSRLIDNRYIYGDAMVQSLVSFNGQALPLCVVNSPITMQEYLDEGFSPELLSNQAPCYMMYDTEWENAMTDTFATVLLPANYDTSAEGTVSVYGIGPYTFNEGATPPTEVSPNVIIDQKPLETAPTVSTRPTFSGHAPAGSIVEITVRSDPVTCITVADTNGFWSCTLATALPAGAHTASIIVTTLLGQMFDLGSFPITVATTTGVEAPQPEKQVGSKPVQNRAPTPANQTVETTATEPTDKSDDVVAVNDPEPISSDEAVSTPEATETAKSTFPWIWLATGAGVLALIAVVVLSIRRSK